MEQKKSNRSYPKGNKKSEVDEKQQNHWKKTNGEKVICKILDGNNY